MEQQNEILYKVDIYQDYAAGINYVEQVYVVASSKLEAAEKARLKYKVEIIITEDSIIDYGKVM